MFYGAGIPACYLVINRAKPPERAGRVLFIDGSEGFDRADTKNVIRPEHIDRVVAAFEDDGDHDEFSAWVPTGTVAERRFNLTVRRYVKGAEGKAAASLPEAIAELRAARAQAQVADAVIEELLDHLEAESR